MPCVPACQRGLRANVLACLRGLLTNVPACQCAKSVSTSYFKVSLSQPTNNVLTCHTACQCAKWRVKFWIWRTNVPKGVPIFQTFLLRNAKGNFYTLSLYKKLYILLDIIVVHKIRIILNFYTSCHITEACVKFFFFIIMIILFFLFFYLFCSLVRNENIKRPGFYTLQVIRVFSNFPQLKQLHKI